MRYFKAVFSRWVNKEEPAIESGSREELDAYLSQKEIFYVVFKNKRQAKKYAKTFEGIETNAHEGLASLVSLEEIKIKEARKLDNLSRCERYRIKE